ncbi:hypothetical protein ANCCEY_15136, partial [Ancylostoma ceylanicum]
MGHYAFDLKELDIDFITCAAHKFHGPKGSGFLYCNKKAKVENLIHGGSQERGLRGGTENLYGIAGLAKAMELAYEDVQEHQSHVQGLKTYMIERLRELLPDVGFHGSIDPDTSLYTSGINVLEEIGSVVPVKRVISGNQHVHSDVKGQDICNERQLSFCKTGIYIQHRAFKVGQHPKSGSLEILRKVYPESKLFLTHSATGALEMTALLMNIQKGDEATFGGATTFIDIDTVAEVLHSVDKQLFERIQSQKIHFGRKDNPIAHNDDFILQKDAIGWKINWNYYRALGDTRNQTLIEDFKAFLDNYIEKSGEMKELKLLPGEG